MSYKTKIRDLVVVRQYYINGINLLIRVDLVKKQASFVEPSRLDKSGYAPKRWLFAEREPEYLKTWVRIFDAMKKATDLVIAELEEIKDAEFKRTVKALAEMGRSDNGV